MIEVIEHVGAKLYYLTRKVVMGDVKVVVHRSKKEHDPTYVPKCVGARVIFEIINPELMEYADIIKGNTFNRYGEAVSFCAMVVDESIEFRGCRDKLKKYNETVDMVNAHINAMIEGGYEDALDNFNQELEDKFCQVNKDGIDTIKAIYGNAGNFNFAEDDDQELVKEVIALQSKMNELKDQQDILNDLIRVNRIECVVEMANRELDPRVAKIVKEEMSQEGTYKRHHRLFP